MIKYPNYDRSILSIASSVLKHFGVTNCNHKTLFEFDEMLNKNYQNIIVMLFDGMGVSALNEHLDETAFLRKHYVRSLSSVFPSTTVSATTSITSGYSPLESAWLGWFLYFKEVNDNVAVFKNSLQKTRTFFSDYNIADTYIPVKSIFERIEEVNGKDTAFFVSPFSELKVQSINDISNTVFSLSKNDKKIYIYTYWNQPDEAMHYFGVSSKEVREQIRQINDEIEKLCNRLKNSLVIVTADHGLCDGVNEYLEDYPKIVALLKKLPSVEPRALSFFVKEGKQEPFKSEFNRIFGDSFRLMEKEEVFRENLFGFGTPHKRVEDFVRDFFAVAIGNKSLEIKREGKSFIGVHAGLTDAEMTVPFIAIET